MPASRGGNASELERPFALARARQGQGPRATRLHRLLVNRRHHGPVQPSGSEWLPSTLFDASLSTPEPPHGGSFFVVLVPRLPRFLFTTLFSLVPSPCAHCATEPWTNPSTFPEGRLSPCPLDRTIGQSCAALNCAYNRARTGTTCVLRARWHLPHRPFYRPWRGDLLTLACEGGVL